MKRLITQVLGVFVLAMMVQWPSTAQNLQLLEKSLIPQTILDQYIQHMDKPLLRAAGLPQKTHGYDWVLNAWVDASYMETVYFPDGQPHIDTYFDVTTSLPTERSTYTYDGPGRVTEVLTESYETGAWENSMKLTVSYDAHGNLYEMMYSYWTGSGWWIIGGMRYNYSYTPQNYVSALMTQTYDFMSGWLNYQNEIYTLAGNGYPTEALFQKPERGWADSARYINIEWHEYFPQSGYGLSTYYEEELWDGSQWNMNLRESTVYDDDGGWVMTEQVYSGGWVNSIRETMLINNGLPLNYKYEQWVEGSWVLLTGEMFLYTFSGENLVEEIIQVFDPEMLAYINNTKSVFSDFFYVTGQNEMTEESIFQLYPNPVTDELNILMKQETGTMWNLEILNVNGQHVISEALDFDSFKVKTVSMNSLPDGIYLLRLKSGQGMFTKTFLKQ
jgi:hypothetical protein